jgi:hypothetical protein
MNSSDRVFEYGRKIIRLPGKTNISEKADEKNEISALILIESFNSSGKLINKMQLHELVFLNFGNQALCLLLTEK